ncbi:MAG TPA: VOC family protein [Thermoanaerobaculia bacterium]|nr:VOC family protein [Thermoanaerobaculia bacterium]
MTDKPKPGTITWFDLTVDDADSLRDFYREVAGWSSTEIDMGGYNDFAMQAADGGVVAGICHRRGPNEALPPQWLVYINVADLDGSLTRCRDLGGTILLGPKSMGEHGRYAVVRDPAGAAFALFESS